MLQNAQAYFQLLYKEISLSKREIDLIVCHELNITTAKLFIYRSEITYKQDKNIRNLLQQRLNGKPLAYITGIKGFWTLDLMVNQHTLIPRPETELIVELLMQWTASDFSGKILDLGTGTGAIALSIAVERPLADVTAVDFSAPCVKVAQSNQHKYKVNNVTIIQSNWFASLHQQKFDFIVSNPPYIAEDDEHLLQLKYEPITALTAKEDGISDLRHIIEQATKHLKPKGRILLEHGYNQAKTVQNLLLNMQFKQVQSHNDLAGIARITSAQFCS